MSHFRKRIPRQLLSAMNEQVVFGRAGSASQNAVKSEEAQDSEKKQDDDADNTPKGKLVIDATCVPEDMKYPTDLGLLNDAREISERIIDRLWEDGRPVSVGQGIRKPRTYRCKARKAFLSIIRQKKPKSSVLCRGISQQIGFLKRNLATIGRMVANGYSLTVLDKGLYRKLLVSAEVLRQQIILFSQWGQQKRRIDDRIVSVHKPHVRPIVRGKARTAVEFGSKISASVIDGFFFVDRLSWDSYNECHDLQHQAQRFRERMGYYPASIHADKIYRNRANIAWCKDNGIRLSGPPLGRPSSDEQKCKAQKKLAIQDERDRIIVEARFGNGKRHFSLGHLMTRLQETSETVIGIITLVMNLGKILRDLFLALLEMLYNALRAVVCVIYVEDKTTICRAG